MANNPHKAVKYSDVDDHPFTAVGNEAIVQYRVARSAKAVLMRKEGSMATC